MKRVSRLLAAIAAAGGFLVAAPAPSSAQAPVVTTWRLTLIGPYAPGDGFSVHLSIPGSPSSLTLCVPTGGVGAPSCASGGTYTQTLSAQAADVGGAINYNFERFRNGSVVQTFASGVVSRQQNETISATFTYAVVPATPSTGSGLSSPWIIVVPVLGLAFLLAGYALRRKPQR